MIDLNRELDFPRLSNGEVYADWTGAAIPPRRLIRAWMEFLENNLLGNPHSSHKPSARSMGLIAKTRRAIIEYFNGGDVYDVIFTANASSAILLLQHYQFALGELLLGADDHNTVNGLREIAKKGGARVTYAPIDSTLHFDEETLKRILNTPKSSSGNRLFAYPAKSNYAGTLHPLRWVAYAKERGWDVLLDAAAFVSNDRLNLAEIKPDFVPISFYKMFGFPTGVGCLLIRKETYRKLHKEWFSGGSIKMVAVGKDFYAPEQGYGQFEDGTPNFGMIPAVRNGLAFMNELGNIRNHVVPISTALYDQLLAMRVNDNCIALYSERGSDIVTFSVERSGSTVNAWEFERAASADGIYVRTGCFCNPGVNEKIFGYAVEPYELLHADGFFCGHVTPEKLREHSGDKAIGAIRASFGYVNTMEDAQTFAGFTRRFLEGL